MLDLSAINQLSQLKQDIRTSKNLAQGTVRGSHGRFGFVTLDDGREAFLTPDEMAKVYPGDRVEVAVEEKEGSDKIDATLETLIQSDLKQVIGQYVVRGKGHFVAVDMPGINRWVFLPPKARAKAQEHDYLICTLGKHPFESGKGTAKVNDIIGKPSDVGIEHKLTCLKHQLETHWSDAQTQQAQTIIATAIEANNTDRRDLTGTQYITIDSASTQDMDDALAISNNDQGWTLSTAIADPSATIEYLSALDKAAAIRANTAYLPGQPITMLPEALAHDTYSLMPEQVRLALVCHMDIDNQGNITHYHFEQASIRSSFKLSYSDVAKFTEGDETATPKAAHELLSELVKCSDALRRHRAEHMLLMEDQDDFHLCLNDQQHIADIIREERNRAQQIVEEAMLATNRCAGELFAKHPNSGIFSAHNGFRQERLESIAKIIKEDAPELSELDIASAEGYRQLIQALSQNPNHQALLSSFKLMLQAGELTLEARPHQGLGMQHYATITSPIRRYNDLYNHRAIKAIIAGTELPSIDPEALKALQKGVSKTRQASRDLEQWLFAIYMQSKTTQVFEGKVSRVNSQGVTVQITSNGISGFVKLNPKTFKLDQERMILKGDKKSYSLNQPLRVQVDRIDIDKKRINFKLVD